MEALVQILYALPGFILVFQVLFYFHLVLVVEFDGGPLSKLREFELIIQGSIFLKHALVLRGIL